MSAERWFEHESEGAPEELRERAKHYIRAVGRSGGQAVEADGEGAIAERLATAARAALDHVVAQAGDRSVALDLLAADALVTLALKARVHEDPTSLERFAAELLG